MSKLVVFWKDHPRYGPDYQVSTLGIPRSTDRTIKVVRNGVETERHLKGRVLSCKHAAYDQVKICKDGKTTTERVHVMVAETFHGPRPPGQQACHVDGNRRNNSAINVKWATPTNNMADKRLHGTQTWGEDHPVSKYTQDLVEAVRHDLLTMTQTEVAQAWELPYPTIGTIKQNLIWVGVGPAPMEPFAHTYIDDPDHLTDEEREPPKSQKK